MCSFATTDDVVAVVRGLHHRRPAEPGLGETTRYCCGSTRSRLQRLHRESRRLHACRGKVPPRVSESPPFATTVTGAGRQFSAGMRSSCRSPSVGTRRSAATRTTDRRRAAWRRWCTGTSCAVVVRRRRRDHQPGRGGHDVASEVRKRGRRPVSRIGRLRCTWRDSGGVGVVIPGGEFVVPQDRSSSSHHAADRFDVRAPLRRRRRPRHVNRVDGSVFMNSDRRRSDVGSTTPAAMPLPRHDRHRASSRDRSPPRRPNNSTGTCARRARSGTSSRAARSHRARCARRGTGERRVGVPARSFRSRARRTRSLVATCDAHDAPLPDRAWGRLRWWEAALDAARPGVDRQRRSRAVAKMSSVLVDVARRPRARSRRAPGYESDPTLADVVEYDDSTMTT